MGVGGAAYTCRCRTNWQKKKEAAALAPGLHTRTVEARELLRTTEPEVLLLYKYSILATQKTERMLVTNLVSMGSVGRPKDPTLRTSSSDALRPTPGTGRRRVLECEDTALGSSRLPNYGGKDA